MVVQIIDVLCTTADFQITGVKVCPMQAMTVTDQSSQGDNVLNFCHSSQPSGVVETGTS